MSNSSLSPTEGLHYVDWPAIIAGVVVSLAISSVFMAFGSALGLSFASFDSPQSTPVVGLTLAAGLWFLWVQITSFIGGAYLAGRMRRKIGDSKPEEAELRDGAHGLIVWATNIAVGTAVAGFLALISVGGALGVATSSSPMDYYVDRLLRSEVSATPPASRAPTTGDFGDRLPLSRILTRAVSAPSMDSNDRAYLAGQISSRTGIPQAEAEKRVDETVASLKSIAKTAQRVSILLAFFTAASFVISAAAAWWAARIAGRHRDEGVDHSAWVRWK